MDEALEDFFVGYLRPAYIQLAELAPEHSLLSYLRNPAEGFHLNGARKAEFSRRFSRELEEGEVKLSTLVSYCANIKKTVEELRSSKVERKDPREAGR